MCYHHTLYPDDSTQITLRLATLDLNNASNLPPLLGMIKKEKFLK